MNNRPNAPLPMPASHPVFRSGLIFQSSLSLTEEEARRGVKFLESRRDEFHGNFIETLKDAGAKNVRLKEPRISSREEDPDIEGRSVKFQDIVFTLEPYTIEARIGVTICEGQRQSKIAVRILCLEIDGSPARELSTKSVTAFFGTARRLTEALNDSANACYTKGLRAYLEDNPQIVGDDDSPAKDSFELNQKYAFTTRAYDSTDKSAFGLIEDLSDGDRLSDLLGQPQYCRVFEELWNVAYAIDEAGEFDIGKAIVKLQEDDDTRLALLDGSYTNQDTEEYAEQRALFVSHVQEPEIGLPRIDFTGVMCEPVLPAPSTDDVERRSAAYRLSQELFANFAKQF